MCLAYHHYRTSSFCASTAETVKTGSSKLAPLFTGSASGGTPRQKSAVICFLTYSLRRRAASPSDVASGSPRFEQTYRSGRVAHGDRAPGGSGRVSRHLVGRTLAIRGRSASVGTGWHSPRSC